MISNFFRIKLLQEDFQVQRSEYSDSKFHQITAELGESVGLHRDAEYIYYSPMLGDGKKYGELVSLNVEKSPRVALGLIKSILYNFFTNKQPDREILGYSPLKFISIKESQDPVSNLVPPKLRGRIGFPRQIEIEVRNIKENGGTQYGLLINVRNIWNINIPLSELSKLGLQLTGKTVQTRSESADKRLKLIGKVESFDSTHACIETNKGKESYSLKELYVQKTPPQIKECIEVLVGKSQAAEIFNNLASTKVSRELAEQTYKEVLDIANWFANEKGSNRIYSNGDSFCFSITNQTSFSSDSSLRLSNTNLMFDYGPGASSQKPITGLTNYGPFNSDRFPSNNFKLLVICLESSRGAMSSFLSQFIDGIPESRYFNQGFVRLLRLSKVSPDIVEVRNGSPDEYEEAISKAVTELPSGRYDLTLVECPPNCEQLPIAENPYYRARAKSMSYGIPTQGIQSQKLSSYGLEYRLAPIALQCYAKAGGTPWRLPSQPTIDHEIVVGVGSSLERPNLWFGAAQNRLVGITSFFLGDGTYIQGSKTKSVPYKDYFDELLLSLTTSISDLSKHYAWNDNDTVRVIFHIYKPLRNIEAAVVDKVIKSFTKYRILYTFVTVSLEHPWRIYKAITTNRTPLGVTPCERGDNVVFDSHSCLVQIQGHSDRTNRRQRPPLPALIRIHHKSTFNDLKYIAQQIQDFSYLSWRSLFPNDKPVTIFYSNLIAVESSKLNKIEGWDDSFIDAHFKNKLWFL